MPPQVSRRPCVFCGATDRKISKEHVWPKSLRKVIELGKGPPIGHSRTQTTRENEVVLHDSWRAIPLDWEVAAPCRSCNEGWMEDIEAAVRPVLIPMLNDERVLLDIAAQDILAQWATLRVMVSQHAHPADRRRSIPDLRYEMFYRTRQIPPGAQIWIGRYSGAGPWPTQYLHREIRIARPDSDPPNAYIAAFAVGYVAFIYWGHEVERGAIVHLGAVMGDFLTGIWPALKRAVTWPPAGLLGADGVAWAAANLVGMT